MRSVTYFFLKKNFVFPLPKRLDNASFLLFPELDVCIYLMSACTIKMEVEEGTSATCSELITSIIEDEKIMLPPQVRHFGCADFRTERIQLWIRFHHGS